MIEIKKKSNFSFKKGANRIADIINQQPIKIAKESAKNIRGNILKGLRPPLKKSTMDLRKKAGIDGANPLFATGKLYKSIKNTKKGVQMLEYGKLHHEGFTTGAKSKIPGKRVPARPFIFPGVKDMLKITKTIIKHINKVMRKGV